MKKEWLNMIIFDPEKKEYYMYKSGNWEKIEEVEK